MKTCNIRARNLILPKWSFQYQTQLEYMNFNRNFNFRQYADAIESNTTLEVIRKWRHNEKEKTNDK